MPSRGTPKFGIRVSEAVWTRLGEAAARAGTDRSAVIRALLAWYLREPGASLPPRPLP